MVIDDWKNNLDYITDIKISIDDDVAKKSELKSLVLIIPLDSLFMNHA